MKNLNMPPTYLPHPSNKMNMELSPLVHLSRASIIANMEPSPPFHLTEKCQTSGKHSRMFSPFTCIAQYCIGSHLALHIAMSCIPVALLPCIYCFFPLLLFGQPPETADDTAAYDDVADDQTPSAELPGKQNPLDHQDIAHSFFLMLALVLLLLLPRQLLF